MERVGNLHRRGGIAAAAITTGFAAMVFVLLPAGARSAASARPAAVLGSQGGSQSAADVVGTIEIVKQANLGDASFGYTTTTGQGGGGLPAEFDLTTSGGTASRVFEVVGGGTGGTTYTVTESSVPDGWEFDDLACTDSDNGDGGTSVNIETRTATIVVNANDQVVCTFTNERVRVTPTVTTEIHDEDHEEITSAAIGEIVHDEAEVSGSAGTPTGEVDFRVWLGNTTCSGDSVSAGSDIELVDGVAHPSDPIVVPAGGLSFRAQYDGDSTYDDEDSECEPLAAQGAQGGTIIVEKQTSPGGAAATFAFSGDAAGSIGDNGQIVVNGLAPGTYTSTEAAATDWILTSISCDDAQSSGDIDTRTATFRLAAGETVKCTFTNAQRTIGRGAIDVQKSASPTSLKEPGGPVTFSVTITNTSDVNLAIENIVDDKFGDLDDEGGNGCFDAPINLAPGQRVNCTFQRAITGVGGTTHVDTVTASGHDAFGNSVTDSDDARVDITPRLIDLVIVKEASSPTPLNGVVNYSLTVTNKGPDTATNVQVADPAPAGITYLTANPSQGTCTVTASLITCGLGTIAAGQTVTINATGRATTVGSHTNTATVTGSGGRETDPADNVDSATTVVPAPLKPPTAKPTPKPEACLALTVSPKMIKADGKPDRVTVRVTAGKKRMKGVKVVVGGSGVRKTASSNGKGLAVLRINPTRAGIITITAIEKNRKVCGPKRIGVVGVFLPPVTG